VLEETVEEEQETDVTVDEEGNRTVRTTTRLADTRIMGPGGGGRTPPVSRIAFAPREPVNEDARDLWDAIRLHTDQIAFPAFQDFVTRALCDPDTMGSEAERIRRVAPYRGQRPELRKLRNSGDCLDFSSYIPGSDLYGVLKLAAEVFLLLRCGVCPPPSVYGTDPGSSGWWTQDTFGVAGGNDVDPDRLADVLTDFLGGDRASYIRGIIRNVFQDGVPRPEDSDGFGLSPFCPVSVGFGPCLLELIWSYWHEEGMLVQTANAIALRFQNVRLGKGRDPLGELEIDPLRPLSGFLWGYIQDEQHRLSVARRAYEYNHHYGLTLYGRAVPDLRPADPRAKFLQSFHDLLRMADAFFREAADNTVTPDAFPLLIALRDLHLILAEGAHNQFRDLPWTARAEMLVQQWLLARVEMRDFLHGRLMVPYPEGWMGAVDAMKKLQGWTDTNIIHFHDLAVFGERILLSVRYVSWNEITDPEAAADWAVSWRPELQGYVHAYRMATGVTLTDEVVEVSRTGDARYLPPSFHLRNRLQEQQPGRALTQGGAGDRLQLRPVSRPAPRER
jgi:hypothetical protein